MHALSLWSEYSMLVAPPAPTSLLMLFVSVFLEQRRVQGIYFLRASAGGEMKPLDLLKICSVPAGCLCGRQTAHKLQKGAKEA